MKKHRNPIHSSEEKMHFLFKSATRAAYRQALKEGNTVLISHDGSIFRTLPNGEWEFVKKARPAKEMKKGEIIEIK